MSQAVWKFPLKPKLNKITMPVGAQVIHVSSNTGEPCLWAVVNSDPDGPKEERMFLIVGTGWRMLDGTLDKGEYLGTFFVKSDPIASLGLLPPVLVYHVFDMGGVPEVMLKDLDQLWMDGPKGS